MSETLYGVLNVSVEKVVISDSAMFDGMIDGSIGDIKNDSVESIKDYCFYKDSYITSIDFPNVKSIGISAFEECANLQKVIIPREVSRLEKKAFYRCTSLSEVVINSDTIEFDGGFMEGVFADCASLNKVIFSNITTVPTGNAVAIFIGTPMTAQEPSGYIYVPDNLLDSFKEAANWEMMVTLERIKPLSELE